MSSVAIPPCPTSSAPAAGAARAADCSHCGLPVPSGLVDNRSTLQFCCAGCRTVFEVIQGSGLDQYYRVRRASSDAKRAPAARTGRRYDEFDDPAFQAAFVRPGSDGRASVELFVQGVHCAACVWLIEKLPLVCAGVHESTLNLARSLVRVVWDPARTSASAIARSLDSLGYPPHPARDAADRDARRLEERRFLVRIGVAGACAGNVMLLAFALYSGMAGGLAAEYELFFRWLSMLIGLVSLAWPGSLFFRGAWAALRTRTPHLDLPIALGLGAGALAGSAHTLVGSGEIYFDSLTVLVFLLLVGRWIQYRQQRGASDALEMLFSLTPTAARLLDADGTVREVSIEALGIGCRLEIRAGDSFPADGTIMHGQSFVDASLLTGESTPVCVQAGDRVSAGTVNLSGRLVVEIEAAGMSTRVGRLMKLVQECAQRRAAIVRFADRIAGWFVAAALALAVGTFGAWAPTGAARAADFATALLIVTCPCALGLATPLAVTVAIGRAARRRILIKGGDALEKLDRPGTLILDKTGTITSGKMALLRWVGDERAKPLVASIEAESSHPIARALVAALGACESSATQASVRHREAGAAIGARHALGGGVEGVVGDRIVKVGSRGFVQCDPTMTPGWLAECEAEYSAQCLTPVRIAVDGQIVALAGLGDPVRADAADAVRQLRRIGWRIRILSGDHPDVVARIAERVGVPASDAIGGATPEFKLETVQRLLRDGPVVMVGDGVNDACALSAATVGIAVHGGAEAALAASDIYLGRPGLAPVVELIRASRGMMRTIRAALGISLAYNMLAAALAATGIINPLIAAVLMPLSSFTVVSLAFAQRSFPTSAAMISGTPEESAACL